MLLPMLALALMLPQTAQEIFPEGGGAAFVARTRDELDKCGVIAKPFSVADEDIHEEVVVALDESRLTDSQVECLANSPNLDGISFAFSDDRFALLYEMTRRDRPDIRDAYADMVARQRSWLEERGLLAGLPLFDPDRPISAFAVAVETHCGTGPGSILKTDEESRGVTVLAEADVTFDQLACTLSAVSVSLGRASGVTVQLPGDDLGR